MGKAKLQFEIGKYYRTRGGRKAYLGMRSPFQSKSSYPLAGFIEGDDCPETWQENGEYFPEDGAHNNDLVAEWVEPKRIKGWVNVYVLEGLKPSLGDVHENRATADANEAGGRIACIEVDVLEGEGLEGRQ